MLFYTTNQRKSLVIFGGMFMENKEVKPRQRRSFTLEEKLEQVNEQIKNLTEEKKQLEKKIHDKQVAELGELLTNSGMTLEELKELVEKNKK